MSGPEPTQVPTQVPTGTPAVEPGAEPPGSPRSGVLRSVHAVWDRTPLVARLVAIITVLLATGLGIAGVTTATLLDRYLVGKVDNRLGTEAKTLAQQIVDGDVTGFSTVGGVPSDYAVAYSTVGQPFNPVVTRSTEAAYGMPAISSLTLDQVIARASDPFTVASTDHGSSWRVVAYPVGSGSTITGMVAVGLPLGDVQSTVTRAVALLVSTAVAIIVAGALLGGWAVRRSLRPLREIEDTAAAIAAGDLSRRVPAAPESTEVGRLGVALNGMLTQIEHAFDARTASEERMRRFVADASHELRTPLATVRGYAELYRMGALTTKPQIDDTMGRIEQSATRMGSLVTDLIALARLDAQQPVRTDPVDLVVLAADALSDLHALDPARVAQVRALDHDGAPRSVVVQGDEGRLRQVLANLVGNVVQHTPAGSPVEIRVGTHPGHGVLEVRDHGPGIDPEHAARVFERFYRIDQSRTRDASGAGGGAGLGMAIVAAIVQAHQGSVEIDQTPGGGTTVRVVLPRADDAPPPPPPPPPPARTEPTAPTPDQPSDQPVRTTPTG
ncbi:two-component sensor histidine kinase [Actinomycetota bacterium]|nr:two-component sensor histidine kinase [Actinomycetota bacterium]